MWFYKIFCAAAACSKQLDWKALASGLSKVSEIVLQDTFNDFIYYFDNQFGYKAKDDTDICIYAWKEMLYFIDASKAFDRVNHTQFFLKRIQQGVLWYVVRILPYGTLRKCMLGGDQVSHPPLVWVNKTRGNIVPSPLQFAC